LRQAARNVSRRFAATAIHELRQLSVLLIVARMKFPAHLVVAALLCLVTVANAETVKDREGAVRGDRDKMQNDARWIYGDIERGFAEAKRTGKPLLVVLRCIPCLSCMGIDSAVLSSRELDPLLDQFVCLRLINANAIDLGLFQFDYDLSFSTLIFNADRTIYGRYGSWKHQKDPADKTLSGYKAALESSLAIHKGYPANKSALAIKQPVAAPFRTPVEIPALASKYKRDLDWEGKVVQSCVHCHQVGDAFRAWHRDSGKPVPEELVFPMPQPETIGLVLAAETVARVESVLPGTPAARAGFRAGDELLSLENAPLISHADIAWALHKTPSQGTVTAVVKRGGATETLTVNLPQGWRRQADISRRVGTWPMRGMALGGLILEEPTPDERRALGLSDTALALRVKGLGMYGKNAAAKKAGFLKDDVLVQLAGISTRATEGQVIAHLLQTTKVGQQVKATVLRAGKRIEFTLPMQ